MRYYEIYDFDSVTDPEDLIIDACENKSLEVLRSLLQRYEPPEKAIHVTIAQGDMLATKLLIENNIRFNLKGIKVEDICRAPLGILELLLSLYPFRKYSIPDDELKFVNAVFSEASFDGRYDIVEFLLKNRWHYLDSDIDIHFQSSYCVCIDQIYNLSKGGILDLLLRYRYGYITLDTVIQHWGLRANKATESLILKMCAQQDPAVFEARDLKDYLVCELKTFSLEKLPYIWALRTMVLNGTHTLSKWEKRNIRDSVNSIESQVMGMIKWKGLDMTCKILEQLVGVSVYAHVKSLAERLPKNIKDVKRLRTHTRT
jgi:hypothetical protein